MEEAQEKIARGSGGIVHKFKKFILIAVGVVVILAIALGVGLGIGLKKLHEHDDDGGSDDNNNTGGNYPFTNTSALWQPKVASKWQIILRKPVDPTAKLTPVDAKIWDIDLFDNSADVFKLLKSNNINVICYFSAGTYEDWRSDAKQFQKSDIGSPLGDWPGESWLKTSSPNVRKIMAARIKLAADKGCSAIDPDNMDGYDNDNGLGLTQADTIDYAHWLAAEASKYNMATGLKNAAAVIPKVIDHIQFSVNEQCVEQNECDSYRPFIDAGKPVFNIEYPKSAGDGIQQNTINNICTNVQKGKAQPGPIQGFSQIIKKMALDGWTQYCTGSYFSTAVINN
ncbi:hypothetical protein VHEMI10415 [[Torrubiella] hemipterigena]|uniref:alpha-galactosidase n=1 Tax=[Torrubiella] hemipterigena TaxID=1531966 RepID=A0A0A1TS38_9HYPO|nr:hypothetical protein VHEMI10415 [[Torrubiella] hemipterigena]